MQECSSSSHFPFPQLSLHTAGKEKDATGATHVGADPRQVPGTQVPQAAVTFSPLWAHTKLEDSVCHRAEGSRGGVGAGLGQPHMPGKVSRQHPPVGHRGLRRTSSPVALSVHRADKSKDHQACAPRAMPL